MSENSDDYFNMVKRIEDAFAEIDSAVVTELTENHDEYGKLKEESDQLKQKYPKIEKVMDGSVTNGLTLDECDALSHYFNLTMQMEDIERQQIYFRGHTDCFAYLKKIGAI